MQPSELNGTPAHYTLEASAAAVVAASIIGALPALAALVGIIWYSILIYESKTVQGWLKKRARHRHHKRPEPKEEETNY